MNVHIALTVRTMEPVTYGIRHYGGVEKLYLLHSPDQEDFKFESAASEIKRKLRAAGFENVLLKRISPFDMSSIVGAILEVAEAERDSPLYINITCGTNLMAAAACAAAFMVGAKAYYVLDARKGSGDVSPGRIIELPIPGVPFMRNLSVTQAKILGRVAEMGGKTSSVQLRKELDMTPQLLSYHTMELERKGLLSTQRGYDSGRSGRIDEVHKVDARMLTVMLTDAGRVLANMIRSTH